MRLQMGHFVICLAFAAAIACTIGCTERKLAPEAKYDMKNVEKIRGELFHTTNDSVE